MWTNKFNSLCDTCCTSWLDLFLTRNDLFGPILFLQKELLILCLSSLSWISKLFSLKHRLFFVGTVLWFLHLFEETEHRWQSRNLLITLDRYASDIFRKHPQFEIEIRGKSWSTFCDKLFWKTRCFTVLTIELILVQGSLLVQKVMAWILNQSPFLQKYHLCC